MTHRYDTVVIINTKWCSLDSGGGAYARPGDMRSIDLERISARPLSSGIGFRYTLSVDMGIV